MKNLKGGTQIEDKQKFKKEINQKENSRNYAYSPCHHNYCVANISSDFNYNANWR